MTRLWYVKHNGRDYEREVLARNNKFIAWWVRDRTVPPPEWRYIEDEDLLAELDAAWDEMMDDD